MDWDMWGLCDEIPLLEFQLGFGINFKFHHDDHMIDHMLKLEFNYSQCI